MKQPLDTKKLMKLCEAVSKDCQELHESKINMAHDCIWANLVNKSLPELQEFLFEK